jgi:hypothetical protein
MELQIFTADHQNHKFESIEKSLRHLLEEEKIA